VFSLKGFLKYNIIEEFYCFILITIEMGGVGGGCSCTKKGPPLHSNWSKEILWIKEDI